MTLEQRRVRNLIWPVYGVLIAVGFIISSSVGVGVIIVGAVIGGMLWSGLSRGGSARPAADGGPRSERAAARAERRAHRRS